MTHFIVPFWPLDSACTRNVWLRGRISFSKAGTHTPSSHSRSITIATVRYPYLNSIFISLHSFRRFSLPGGLLTAMCSIRNSHRTCPVVLNSFFNRVTTTFLSASQIEMCISQRFIFSTSLCAQFRFLLVALGTRMLLKLGFAILTEKFKSQLFGFVNFLITHPYLAWSQLLQLDQI